MLSDQHLQELATAKMLLESPGVAARLSNSIGKPIENGLASLPANWQSKIGDFTQTALTTATNAAVLSLGKGEAVEAKNRLHKFAVAASGGVGGFLGLAGFAAELPISTTIMLRSIADIARSEGENLADPQARLACIEVFALGGGSESDDGAESGYFAVRAALAQSTASAAAHIAEHGMASKGAPALARLIAAIAERFSIQVSKKAMAQAVPALGAAGGALINTLFIDHFQDMARGHFVVRKLEREYGREQVQRAWKELEKSGSSL